MAYDKVVDSAFLDSIFTQIANALREKTNTENKYSIDEIAQAISGISTSDNSALIGLIERSLTYITIPNTVTNIGNCAFQDCRALKDITIPDSVTSIGEYAFYNTGISGELILPKNLTTLSASAFYNCVDLISVTIPESVTSIGNMTFYNCAKLENIIFLGNNITHINSHAFRQTALISAIIPEGVISLGSDVFNNCRKLTTVSLPKSLTVLGDLCFRFCESLVNVTLGEGKETFNCNNLDLSASKLYSTDTIVSWLIALADRTGQSDYTLKIGADNLAKLTDEQKAIATNKNWNLA